MDDKNLRRTAAILALIAAFAAGDLIGPLAPAGAQTGTQIRDVVGALKDIARETRLLRQDVSAIRRNCNDPLKGI